MTKGQQIQIIRFLETAMRNIEGAKDFIEKDEREIGCSSSTSMQLDKMCKEINSIIAKAQLIDIE